MTDDVIDFFTEELDIEEVSQQFYGINPMNIGGQMLQEAEPIFVQQTEEPNPIMVNLLQTAFQLISCIDDLNNDVTIREYLGDIKSTFGNIRDHIERVND